MLYEGDHWISRVSPVLAPGYRGIHQLATTRLWTICPLSPDSRPQDIPGHQRQTNPGPLVPNNTLVARLDSIKPQHALSAADMDMPKHSKPRFCSPQLPEQPATAFTATIEVSNRRSMREKDISIIWDSTCPYILPGGVLERKIPKPRGQRTPKDLDPPPPRIYIQLDGVVLEIHHVPPLQVIPSPAQFF